MSNPYEPPARAMRLSDASGNDAVESQTPVGRLVRALCFAGGCILGVHLGVAVEDGASAAFQRTWIDPAGAFVHLTTLSLICISFAAAWKWIRGRIFRKYVATADARFVAGLVTTSAFYLLATFLSRQLLGLSTTLNASPWWEVCLAGVLLVVTLVAVELEVYWSYIRSRIFDVWRSQRRTGSRG